MPSRTLIARGEVNAWLQNSIEDRLTLLLWGNAPSDFKLKPMITYHSKNPRVLKNYAKSTLPVLYKWNNKAWITAQLLQPTVETYYLGKKIPFKIFMFTDIVPGRPRALMMYIEINVVFMPAHTTSILQSMDQGVILTSKFYYLNTFCKAIADTESDSTDDSEQS